MAERKKPLIHDPLRTGPKDPTVVEAVKKATPARVAIGRAGPCFSTKALIKLWEDTAVAKDAIWSELSDDFPEKIGVPAIMTKSTAKDKMDYILFPDKGKKFDDESLKLVKEKCKEYPEIQFVVCDGLSAYGIEKYVPQILPKLVEKLKEKGFDIPNPTIIVRYGRLGITECIGELLHPTLCVTFVADRPGFAFAESISAFLTYKPTKDTRDANRDAYCNIWEKGTKPEEAVDVLAKMIEEAIRVKKYTGVKVE